MQNFTTSENNLHDTKVEVACRERISQINEAGREMMDLIRQAKEAEYRYRDLVASTFSDRSFLKDLLEYKSQDESTQRGESNWPEEFSEIIVNAEAVVADYEREDGSLILLQDLFTAAKDHLSPELTSRALKKLGNLSHAKTTREFTFPASVLNLREALPHIIEGAHPALFLRDCTLEAVDMP